LDGDPNLPTDQHPTVLAALAAKEKAALDLKRTTVYAPTTGIVSQVDNLNVGQYVSAGTAMLAVVETGETWLEANFKETQLGHVAEGQPAQVQVDTYPDLRLTCSVGSVGAATGSEFSLIPAQNATGNWVKVVQRIPVRIRCSGDDGGKALRMGMSAEVTIDTGRTWFDRTFGG
jgi:membrane fusion protein (multidrug efflux system)